MEMKTVIPNTIEVYVQPNHQWKYYIIHLNLYAKKDWHNLAIILFL